jgi:CRISPR-associated protein Csb3
MELNVNLRNPAQFFAAAGLVKLLDVESRFDVAEHEGQPLPRARLVLPDFDLSVLLKNLREALITEQQEGYSYDDEYSRPVVIMLPGQTVELDWWLNEFWSDKSRLKLWAGTMTPLSMLKRLAEMIDPKSVDDIFNVGVEAVKRNRPSFGFDPRMSRNTGVAGNLAKVRVYPATEILAVVGLQYFRPVMGTDDITFHVWRDELPPELAAVSGAVEGVQSLALAARREKCSKGMFNFTAAEFVGNGALV